MPGRAEAFGAVAFGGLARFAWDASCLEMTSDHPALRRVESAIAARRGAIDTSTAACTAGTLMSVNL